MSPLPVHGDSAANPAADYHGPDFFTYTASDGQSASAPVTVELTVTAVNDAPTAVADAYGTAEDTTLTVTAPGVLGNDSDPDGDALSAVVGTAPGHAASFTLNPDGSFSYTPAADYHGPDFFTYTVSDGQSASAPVTVELTVTAVNDAPTAVVDAYSTSVDNVLTVPAPGLLGNDSEPDGDPLTATLAAAPASGMVMLNPDGSFSYTPNAGFLGTDSFTYWSSDPVGASDQATVTITVSEPVPAGCTIIGTSGNDFLIGGRGNDVICGLGGKDTLYGGPGDDIVDGGSGDDFLIGGPGNDVIRGSAGDDTLYGDPGDDTLDGGSGNDTVNGGGGIDAVLGGSGNDRLLGGPGDDTLDGGIGNDVAAGGFDDDRITGGAGADRLNGEFGNDTLLGADGVAGNDTVSGGFGTDMCTADPRDLVIGCP